MIATETRVEGEIFPAPGVVKKVRTESSSSTDSNSALEANNGIRNLELEGVKEIFQDYDLLETAEAVRCVICGKNYKSKVCVKKHLWEHSVYWDLFDGLKKQQRVLSIQAAIILAIKFNPSLSLLLVTQSSSGIKKKSSSEKASDKSEKLTEKLHCKNSINNNNNNNNNISSTRTDNDNFISADLSLNRKRKLNDSSYPPKPDSFIPRKNPYIASSTRGSFTNSTTTDLNRLTNQL